MNIQFTEKEPVRDFSLFTGDCLLCPNYMIKDGKEYFMFNRRVPSEFLEEETDEERKEQLKRNNGSFFKFHGIHNCPLQLIKFVRDKGYTFTESKNKVFHKVKMKSSEEFYDFIGNLNEVSCFFHYRIYDKNYAEEIQKSLDKLKKGKKL